jgi:hypothetical protein
LEVFILLIYFLGNNSDATLKIPGISEAYNPISRNEISTVERLDKSEDKQGRPNNFKKDPITNKNYQELHEDV